MKLPFAALAASLVCLIVAPVFAQTTPTPAAPTATVPVPATKRVTCLGATQSLKGQDKRDQMQLCMAQARPHGCGFGAPGKCRCSTAAGVA